MSSKSPISKSSESDATEKIYITIPKKYVSILEIIAGDPREKSKIVEKMIDNFIDTRQEALKREGKWNKILVALRGLTLEGSLEEKIVFIDKWVEKHPNNKELEDYWFGIRSDMDETKIIVLYNKIKMRVEAIEQNLDEILSKS